MNEDEDEECMDNTEILCDSLKMDILTESYFRLFKPVFDDLESNIRDTLLSQVELR